MHFLPSCFLALTVQSKAYNMEILLENQTVSMEFTIYPLWLSWKEYLTKFRFKLDPKCIIFKYQLCN